MRRFSVLGFCIFTVAITVYGFVHPSYHLQQLINPGLGNAIFRIAAAAVLAAYELWPRFRTALAKQIARAWGLLLLGYGLVTFISPTFLGSFWSYVPLGDVFVSIEGGVLALFLSMQLPVTKTASYSGRWEAVKGWFSTQPQKLLPSAALRSK